MGSGLSHQSKYVLYESVEKISGGKIHRVDSRHNQYFDDLVQTLAESFTGTEKIPPEAISDWLYSGNERRGQHLQPLGKPPPKDRLAMMHWIAKYFALGALDYGGCFVMVEPETGRVVAATISFPPGDKKNSLSSFFTDMWVKFIVGPPPFTLEASKRFETLLQSLQRIHESAVSEKHWYILHFGTNPNQQGKGYGVQLMQFLKQLADANKVLLYLETVGYKNVGFYTKAGFSALPSTMIRHEDQILDDDGGVTPMVRQPAS